MLSIRLTGNLHRGPLFECKILFHLRGETVGNRSSGYIREAGAHKSPYIGPSVFSFCSIAVKLVILTSAGKVMADRKSKTLDGGVHVRYSVVLQVGESKSFKATLL